MYLKQKNENKLDKNNLNHINVAPPIGGIMLLDTTSNPATLYPGTTWQKKEGRYLLGTAAGENSGSIGGISSITLTTENLPQHNHNLSNLKVNSAGEHKHQVDNHTHTQPAHVHDAYGRMDDSNTVWETGLIANTAAVVSQVGRCRKITGSFKSAGGENTGGATPMTNSNGGHVHTISGSVANTGNGKAIQIQPSFYKIHVWKRMS